MLVLGVLTLLLGSRAVAVGPDTAALHTSSLDTLRLVWSRPAERVRGTTDTASIVTSDTGFLSVSADTIRRRRRSVDVSEWYSRRLTIHRYVAYATIPVFALQYAAGNELFTKGASAPTWAKTMHRVGATSLAAMFTVNTVTGAWNWWDSRSASNGRVLRTIHALTMLGTDAAFTYAGAKLSEEAENSNDKRRLHRKVALISIGVSTASGVAMKLWNR